MKKNKNKPETTGEQTEDQGAAETGATDPVEQAVNRGVQRWIDENLRNTSFSKDTKAWNHLQSVLPALASVIVGEIK